MSSWVEVILGVVCVLVTSPKDTVVAVHAPSPRQHPNPRSVTLQDSQHPPPKHEPKSKREGNATHWTEWSDLDPDKHPYYCGNRDYDNIVGGEEASPHSMPWMVYMKSYFPSGKVKRCSGTLISSQWVITAAHCLLDLSVDTRARLTFAVLGVHSLDKCREERQLVYRVHTSGMMYVHEHFEKTYMMRDMALLKIPSEVPSWNHHVQPACLQPLRPSAYPWVDDGMREGDRCQVAGWGAVSHSPIIQAKELRRLDVVIRQCPIVDPDTICTSSLHKDAPGVGTRDSCHGDSGGPLICTGGGKTFLAGILSGGSEKCDDDNMWPARYTRVSESMEWIARTMRDN